MSHLLQAYVNTPEPFMVTAGCTADIMLSRKELNATSSGGLHLQMIAGARVNNTQCDITKVDGLEWK